MENWATFICTGTIVSVDNTGIKSEVPFPGVGPEVFYFVRLRARVKVLHTFKGTKPAEFELNYDILDPDEYREPMGNGPERILLQIGARYRFFLKPGGGKGEYVGVLQGELDDCFAVDPLWPDEKDSDSYLKKDEAIKIARDYLAVQRPGAKFEGDTSVDFTGYSWGVILRETHEARSSYAAINIRGDRMIDTQHSKLQDWPQ